MFERRFAFLSLLLATISFCGCKPGKGLEKQPEIAVANSYLHCVIKDICGNQTEVLSLVPPGMCPGHFDISPSQVNQLCNCKMLFVFDFQQNIENAAPRIRNKGLKVCRVAPPQGLCIPDTYLSIARQVAGTLSENNPSRKVYYDLKLAEIENRMKHLSRELAERIELSGLKNSNVIASQHQAEFAQWLGLNPVSTFTGSDTTTPAQINENLQQAEQYQIRFIIANKQEGAGLAKALAEHLRTGIVIFSNFPEQATLDVNIPGFDSLLNDNVNNLIEASK
ncbi:MAG: zinc ABC transporter substrate-binding protein [Sedimentisphaerales bacterium]|nr:zinc ABC transporter substrate-binding protein [Sedimentisphaerales bacterium]